MNFTQIKETCLYTKNLERAEDFYCHILGLEKIVAVQGRHVFFKVGTSVLLIFDAEETRKDKNLPPHFGSGQLHLALEVDGEEAYISTYQKILAAGIEIEHEQDWPGNFKSFYFRDADGHLLEVVQKGMWQAAEK